MIDMSSRFLPVCEARLDGSRAQLQNGGDLLNGEVFEVMQRQDSPARRRNFTEQQVQLHHQDCRAFFQAAWEFVHFHVFFVPYQPHALSAQKGERGARGNAVSPGAKEFWLLKRPQMTDDFDEYVLQNILSSVRADEAADVLVEDCLHPTQQLFKRLSISGLGEEDQMRLMDAVVQKITFH